MVKKLIETGFEYVTNMDGRKLFKKKKITLVTPTFQKGSSASLVQARRLGLS